MAVGKTDFIVEPGKPTIVMTRVFDAPCRLVFEAMTKPEHMARWYGLRGSTVPLCEIDLRPGGAYRIIERMPDGSEHGFRGVYREVTPHAWLVYTWVYEPMPDKETLVTDVFDERDGRTTYTSTTLFQSVEDREGFLQSGATEGGAQTMDRLAELLDELQQKRRALVIERVFDAPRELVWKAWTDPEMFKRWWGPKDFTVPHCTIDLRVGGKYLYCMRGPDGQDTWATGVYREIVPPERLVKTDSFADAQGNVVPATHYGMGADFPLEMQVTVTFEEYQGNKTKMTLRHVGLPVGEMSEQTGAGWNESFDKLVEALRKA
jgi:uncharacterized protein YndB with AHSA1/START domain